MLDPGNPFADLVPTGTPGVINGPPEAPKPVDPLDRESKELDIKKKRQELGLDPPEGAAGASDMTGADYLKTLDAPTAAMVKALAEGRKAFPSGAALRNPYWQNMLTHVSNFDPGFDETTYTSRAATRRDFSIGTAGKNIRALNTAIGHLGTLYGQAEDTASHGLVPLNYLENAARKATGDSGPTTYAATTSALAGELTAVYRGSGGAEADIKRYIDELSPNASAEQKRATIANIATLLKSRLEALQDQYHKGMGVGSEGYQFLDPHAQQVLDTLNPGTPPSGPTGTGGDTPPGAGQLTPEQQKADRAFLAANPQATPEQYAKFLEGITGEPQDLAGTANRLKAAQAGGTYSGAVDRTTALRARIEQENKLGTGETPLEALSAQGRTFNLSDEAAGIGNAAANAIVAPFSSNVNFDPVGAYTSGRDVERQRIADARQQLGYGGSAIEFGSALATTNPAGALEAIAPRAAAAMGALSGFGSDEGAGQSLTSGGVGALGGYAVGRYAEPALNVAGRAVGKVLPQSLKTRLLPSRGLAPEVADAAAAENVPLIRPMVDETARAKYGTLESSPASQSTIRAGFGKTLGAIEDRVKSLGGTGTSLAETEQVGNAAQTGGAAWLKQRTTLKNRLYGKAEGIAGDKRFVPQDALNEAGQVIKELSGNEGANAAEIDFIKTYLGDLSKPGGKTVAEIRNLREGLSAAIRRNNLTMDGAGVRALRILNAAKGDISKNVPEAAAAYSRADKYFSTSQTVVDDLQASILGTMEKKIEPQVAAQNLRSMLSDKSTGRRFARIMDSLDGNARQDIAATWAEALGRAAPDAPFELGKFLSQTNGLSPSALRTAFGPEAAQSVKNLRLLARTLKDSGKDINYSRSGTNVIRYMARNFLGGVTGLGTVGALATHSVEGAGTGAAIGLAAGTAAGVRDILSARAMVNPRVSQWLGEAATVSTRTGAHAVLRKLSVIINREPALAAELTPIYNRIGQALSRPMETPLAANPDQGAQANDE